ncbi:MAG: UbiA family prenyltransferase, partial [Planctomycetota bacterium]
EREAAAAVPAALLLVLAAVGRTQGCTLANDLSDRSDDAAAGKSRWVQALPPPAGAAIAAAWLALGIAAVAIPSSARAALPACLASAALGVLYSLPPARFKARGVLGPIAFAASCVLIYGLSPWATLAPGSLLPAALLPAIFFDKWANLHFHQVLDLDADRARGVPTLAVRLGPIRAASALRVMAALATLSLLAVPVALVLAGPRAARIPALLALLAAAAAAIHAARARRSRATPLVGTLPAAYLGLTFGIFRVLPAALLASDALRAGAGAATWVLALLAALFAAVESAPFVRYRHG